MVSKGKITKKAVDQIKAGKVRMRPRRYFAALFLLASIGLSVAAIAFVYITNLFVFKVRLEASGRHAYALKDNFSYFTTHLPWVALLVGVICAVLLVWIVKKFDFSYRLGRWTIVLAVLISVLAGSALAFTNINQHLENFGPTRSLYGQKNQSHSQQQNKGQSPAQKGRTDQQQNQKGKNEIKSTPQAY